MVVDYFTLCLGSLQDFVSLWVNATAFAVLAYISKNNMTPGA